MNNNSKARTIALLRDPESISFVGYLKNFNIEKTFNDFASAEMTFSIDDFSCLPYINKIINESMPKLNRIRITLSNE